MHKLPKLEPLTGEGRSYLTTPEYRAALKQAVDDMRPMRNVTDKTGLTPVTIYDVMNGRTTITKKTYKALAKL